MPNPALRKPDAKMHDVESLATDPDVVRLAGGAVRPPGYPLSLGMCVLDAVWSLGVNYTRHVEPVLGRYASARGFQAPRAVTDSASDMATFVDRFGGGRSFADLLGNRQMTSTRGGVLKAEAVQQACSYLAREGIETPVELVARADLVERGWRRIPGQKSSATGWRYLLLLAGAAEVKPDRMVCRFLARRIGRNPSADEAHDLIVEVARRVGVDPAALDHSIWRFESGR